MPESVRYSLAYLMSLIVIDLKNIDPIRMDRITKKLKEKFPEIYNGYSYNPIQNEDSCCTILSFLFLNPEKKKEAQQYLLKAAMMSNSEHAFKTLNEILVKCNMFDAVI